MRAASAKLLPIPRAATPPLATPDKVPNTKVFKSVPPNEGPDGADGSDTSAEGNETKFAVFL